MSIVPEVALNDGHAIPQFGLGVYKTPPDITRDTVATAFGLGYRHIDTAAFYHNESGVGEAVAASNILRDGLFITTKLWNDAQGYDAALAAFDTSLARLGLDYVNLYLIHWPCPANDLFVDTWKAFLRLREEGRVKSIGVSNFRQVDLETLIDKTGEVPAINQIESHPFLQQHALRDFHRRQGIITEAWAPLAKGGELLTNDIIQRIARKHQKTPAQVVLRWHLDIDTVVFPKSITPSRIKENFDVFDFALDEDDIAAIATLDRNQRLGSDPSVVK